MKNAGGLHEGRPKNEARSSEEAVYLGYDICQTVYFAWLTVKTALLLQ